MHAGNTVIDIKEIKEYSVWATEVAIKELQYELKRLKEIKKNKKK